MKDPNFKPPDLLSRYAETAFWMARYMERAENLARVLDVNETFSRDSQGGQNWHSVLQLYDDGERFHEDHATAGAEAVIAFYTLDLPAVPRQLPPLGGGLCRGLRQPIGGAQIAL